MHIKLNNNDNNAYFIDPCGEIALFAFDLNISQCRYNI